MNEELKRITENKTKEVPLVKWGSYLSERQWGTVREDYSANGDAWNYFPHDHARSRAYAWGEDGLGGISDNRQNLCFALALWNGKDPILKERLYGLTNSEGNHGEDVKELYYFLDNSPTHSYMKFLYKYPIDKFPYEDLIETNQKRSKLETEYELLDTGILEDKRYHDVTITYAKNNPDDICIKIEIVNRSAESAPLTVLPTLWFKNNWTKNSEPQKPTLQLQTKNCIAIDHSDLGTYNLYFQDTEDVLFTDNETNTEKIFNQKNDSVFVKDAFHEALCNHNKELKNQLVNRKFGTKCAPLYDLEIEAHSTKTIYLRLTNQNIEQPFDATFGAVFETRLAENNSFFDSFFRKGLSDDQKNIQRQAFAGLLWSKQFYNYNINQWLTQSPENIELAPERLLGRNVNWRHLVNQDVISMPDTWEYPWYAAWDLAFHCIPMGMIDPTFAKNQLLLIMREWYMSPNGQIPAYEWNFSDVNPPIQAWSALQVYKIENEIYKQQDVDFLKRIFQKLLINFTWWANRQDDNGNNIFNGGFLGLDNIAVIDRNNLPEGYSLEQVDATAWMAMYALNMMEIAIEITLHDATFEDLITKFYEHFILIANSLNQELWDYQDNFFYDLLFKPDGSKESLKIRSIVGITSMFAVAILPEQCGCKMDDFQKRRAFFNSITSDENFVQTNEKGDLLFSLLDKFRLEKLLGYLLDENEFLADNGIRAVSKYHEFHPFSITIAGIEQEISYEPGDSTSGMFGGNSNWRGPIWIPINYLIIKSLAKFGEFYGDSFKVEFPTRSGNLMNLSQIAQELSKRIISIFELDSNGARVVHGDYKDFYKMEENKDLVLFYEYFHGETGRGVGASHQTGWTAVVAELISKL
ncbi:glucosidase [Flavobacterium faecale]|uniref:Glucosidase n=1 Tax=Flavobacterium faecale TaxID=1355330 RepID=A0A2S1LJ00_9FLAO|nr:glucosidase [Flavobacterium faecale]AWG23611.1 glucosidase [Flavobacterium faecale]